MIQKTVLISALILILILGLTSCITKTIITSRSAPKAIVVTEEAPAAIGPYSQGVLHGGALYLSGQIAIDPKTGELVTGDIKKETHLVLENIGAVLKTAGMGYEDVVQAQVFLKDLNDYAVVNEIYAQYFSEHPPARAAVQVARLPRDVSIEIMCVASLGAGAKKNK
ncbi:MAG: RidA family protein [Planctomycetota bacterium]|jgi:2-iminobutanoate/2-iminopropanoate deaminase